MEKTTNNTKPRVSVVCVSYNHVDFIERTIKGFLTQKTTFPFEIIIGDDFSTDGTVEIIHEYFKKNNDKIKPIFRNRNIGGSKNLTNCLKSATGDYIAYCEGDDYWTDNEKLQKQFDLLESNLDVGLLWTDIDVNDLQAGKLIKSAFRNNYFPVFDMFEDILINKPFFAPSTWFFREQHKDLFSNYSEYVDGSFPFILDIIKCSKILHMNEVTGSYTKRIESASNNINPVKRYEFAKLVFKIQIDYSNKYNVSNNIVDKICINHYKTLLHYAIIARDNDFLIVANKKLSNSNDARVFFLLLISRNKLLSQLFRILFKNNKITKLIRYFLSNKINK